MNILKKVNIFSKSEKKSTKSSITPNLYDSTKDKDYEKLRTV